jgi:tetratricopeptide (TPR) repeat protein
MRAIFREAGCCWKVRFGAALLFLLASGAVGAEVVRPTNHLARARAYLAAGRDDLAEECARRAAEANEANGEAYLFLGILLNRRGDGPGAVRALARAAVLRPEDPQTRDQLAQALRTGFPSGIEEGLFRVLPGDRTDGELNVTDPRLAPAEKSPRRWEVLIARESETGIAQDPKYRVPYPRAAYGYVLQERPTRWHRVVTVRFRSAADAVLARRVASLIAQLFWARREYVSPADDFSRMPVTTVWLAREGRAGGEEWKGEIYLYDVARARSAEEWMREVTHEYGHVALPGESIFTQPEPKANGYLGERLLATWLWRNGVSVWDGAVDLDRYLTRRAVPLRRRFLQEGPGSALASGRDAAAMEYYIGAVLSWEAIQSPAQFRAAFERAGGGGADRFLKACRSVIDSSAERGLEITADGLLDAASAADEGNAAWVCLPAGHWELELESSRSGTPAVRWDGRRLSATRQGPRAVFAVQVASPGWHRLEVAGIRAGLRRLAFVRAEAAPPGSASIPIPRAN